MEKFISLILRRRWLVATVFLLVCAFGVYAWTQLALDAYPDIADTTVQVVTQVPGLAAEEMEQQITIPLERSLNGLPSLKMMRSTNTFGISTIMLVFQDGTEDYWARQRVRECIDEVDLPFDAAPELNPLTSPTGEVFRYILKSDNHSLRELTDLNKWVVIPRLTQISGVASVSNYGGITTQYQLEIDPEKLSKYGISLSEVEESINLNNSNAGGSTLVRGDQSFVVRAEGLITDLKDMESIVVRNVQGTPVFLGDLGTLRYGNLERKGILGYLDDTTDYSDGVEGIIQILRYQNPSEVLDMVHSAVDELNSDVLPHGVQIYPVLDRTNLVNATLDTVAHTLLFGMLLVVGVLLLFLGSIKSAVLVAITIPISLLVAFILMHFTGIPANLLSLGAIDFGILVDGAIVMMETILKKREDDPSKKLEGKDVVKRVGQVAKPVFFSTLIIITAYLPLFTFQSIEKKMFTPMAFTVGYALAGALMVALILIPGMGYAVYRKPQKVFRNKFIEKLIIRYRERTSNTIERPRWVYGAIAGVLCTVAVFAVLVGKDFLPTLDEGGIWIQVQTPPGISLNRSAQMADSLRHVLKQFPEVSYVMTQVGRDDEGTEAFSPSHIECSVGLKPYKEWKTGRDKEALVDAMGKEVARMPGYKVGFSQPIIDMVMDQMAGSHSDLAIKIYGEDLVKTREIATQVLDVVSGIPGAADVVIDQEPPLPQLKITADRARIAQYGLNVADVADLIEVAIGGKAVSQVFIGSRVYDVTCRYTESSRSTPEQIGNLMLTSSGGASIPLSSVARIETSLGASSIMREMGRRYLTVRLNLRGRDLTSFLSEAQARIDESVIFDHTENQIRWDGQFENQSRAYRRLMIIIPFVLLLMFLLLFGAFGKFRQAGLLIALLPMALFGGLVALTARGMTFNISSAVGFIALFGLTIQNGVIMISHINDLRREGTPLKDAVINGAAHRFRPVLMTATVAVLGLLPASMASGIGSDVQRPLATVIVYGLLFSTIITLYILPVLYYKMEQLHDRKHLNNDEEDY
ncbi:MAG: CusA/CzcA family heavy metal efflux RND transporter [Bacteroidales bacterium]|nr:CusA/CzcA family heavy metal efflux RND transporter [Bacteroidales bacterium]